MGHLEKWLRNSQEKFEIFWWRRMDKTSCSDRVKNEEKLYSQAAKKYPTYNSNKEV